MQSNLHIETVLELRWLVSVRELILTLCNRVRLSRITGHQFMPGSEKKNVSFLIQKNLDSFRVAGFYVYSKQKTVFDLL